jgi:hypothetical protein
MKTVIITPLQMAKKLEIKKTLNTQVKLLGQAVWLMPVNPGYSRCTQDQDEFDSKPIPEKS